MRMYVFFYCVLSLMLISNECLFSVFFYTFASHYF